MRHQGTAVIEIADDIPVVHPKAENISGRLGFNPTGAECAYSKISLRNDDTGAVQSFDDVRLGAESKPVYLTEINAENYTLSFEAIKSKQIGRKSFEIRFAYSDEDNFGLWNIGGWQNQDAELVVKTNGRGSCLTQSLFAVKEGQKYSCELQVKGREITARIDGVEINRAFHRQTEIRDLYYAASYDEPTNDLILKVVNLKESAADVEIEFSGSYTKCAVYEMSGFALDAKNTLSQPNQVCPKEYGITLSARTIIHTFKPHSFTVLRFLGKKNVGY
jgi:alpha-L-arabinofuranosidase